MPTDIFVDIFTMLNWKKEPKNKPLKSMPTKPNCKQELRTTPMIDIVIIIYVNIVIFPREGAVRHGFAFSRGVPINLCFLSYEQF